MKTNLSPSNISWLWQQLTALYGPLFINKFGASDAAGTWFETLKSLTPLALEKGLERLRNLSAGTKFCEYPPNCLQFKALCLAFYEEQNLPSAGEAYQEISLLRYKKKAAGVHPLIKLIASRLPAKFYSIDADYVAYPIFKTIYEQVCLLVQQGHRLTESEPFRIPELRQTPDVAKTYLRQIKHDLGA